MRFWAFVWRRTSRGATMRLETGGLIDRTHPVRFSFGGDVLTGFSGDTLASALLANDVRLIGRSFKYHRPRGVMTAGPEEPNALVEVFAGDRVFPNIRATVQELHDGLNARPQNCWPSLRWDLLALNDLMHPFLGAGFYYKTFMWPRAWWERVYEPLIRRAAGLGRLSGKDDQLPHDKAFAHCDVLVIGAGPAGLIAARAAAAAGADVILADEDFLPGGRLNAESWQIDGQPASAWAAATMRDLAARDNVRIMTRTAVVGVYDGGIYGALERVGAHRPRLADGMPMSTFWRIAAGQAIMATGAHERPLLFPGNDRPGVMQAGALRAYVNRFGVAPGRRIAVLGSGPGALATVRDCHAAAHRRCGADRPSGRSGPGGGGRPGLSRGPGPGHRGPARPDRRHCRHAGRAPPDRRRLPGRGRRHGAGRASVLPSGCETGLGWRFGRLCSETRRRAGPVAGGRGGGRAQLGGRRCNRAPGRPATRWPRLGGRRPILPCPKRTRPMPPLPRRSGAPAKASGSGSISRTM